MEPIPIIQAEPLDPNETITIINEDKLEELRFFKYPVNDQDEEELPHSFEALILQSATLNRKCTFESKTNDFLQNRINVLKKLDRNIFRLETALFLGLLESNQDYKHQYMNIQRKEALIKRIEGDSCLTQITESQNQQLTLTF